ncbi:hypothetical protein GQ457_12G019280 [Hibiscus cannabinus]
MESSSSFFLIYILFSCFNLLGLATAMPVTRGNETHEHALLQFKAKITGDQLRIMDSWNSSIHFCNGFYNQIPQEICRLKRLQTLGLTNNSISGEIPSNLSVCSKLINVRMRGNHLTGEIHASLSFLSNLKVLSFFNNSLRRSIPPSLGNLSSLEALALTYNALTGVF